MIPSNHPRTTNKSQNNIKITIMIKKIKGSHTTSKDKITNNAEDTKKEEKENAIMTENKEEMKKE